MVKKTWQTFTFDKHDNTISNSRHLGNFEQDRCKIHECIVVCHNTVHITEKRYLWLEGPSWKGT